MSVKKAVLLLSGGLDSATVCGVLAKQGYEIHALSFEYGQRHVAELAAARRVASYFKVARHIVIPVALNFLQGSALINAEIAVPTYDPHATAVPVTYVPGRNTLFISYALSYAEHIGAKQIFVGASSVDFSGYRDCRPEYFEAFNHLTQWLSSIQIETPLLHLSKAQTIHLGLENGVDYRLTVSCYQANEQGEACGTCDSCALRRKGFVEAGVSDPTCYKGGHA